MAVVHIEVTGYVQGVGFRWFVRERAKRLDLAGWVRNLGSGSVEIAAAGPDAVVASFIALVKEGPPGAIVRQMVELAPLTEDALTKPFSILR